MARIISIVNQKGGTGKSACTANLAVGLAQKNMKVLIVDADPQSDVSAGFGYRDCDDSNETLTALMDTVMKDEDIPSDCYIRHQAEGIDIICSNIGLAGTEVQLVNAMSREYVLKQILYGKERISLLPIDVGKYSFRDKISGVMCMGVLGHLKRDEQEKLLYKLDKNLNINVPILIELLEPKFLVAPVGSRISVATQGRLRYETYITDIKQVGMDQWTWRLTYKVFCGKNIVSTVDSLMSWNYQSVEKILNQLTKMHFRTAKLSETLLLAIKAR